MSPATSSSGPRRFKVVVDAGNGIGGVAALPDPEDARLRGRRLYCDPDGRFPNHHPDPTVADEHRRSDRGRCAATGAEVGIALDGDADRIGAVDGKGRIIWGDQLMILFARGMLEEKPGATFVGEVKCSQAMYDEIAAARRQARDVEGRPLADQGEDEGRDGAKLAGEMSGHMFFAHRWFGFDDAIYAGARLLELLSRATRRSPSARHAAGDVQHARDAHELPRREQVRGGQARRQAGSASATRSSTSTACACSSRGDVGWGLVRASNTQPVLVMRFEADSNERLAEIKSWSRLG